MTVQVMWDDDAHTIVHHLYVGTWTWDEFHTTNDKLQALMDSVSHTVDAIVDFSNAELVPEGFTTELGRLTHVPAFTHPNAGIAIVVGGNNIHKTLLDVFKLFFKRMGERIFEADTLDDARMLIAQRRREAV